MIRHGCLGKQAPRHDKRTFQLAKYLVPGQLPNIPNATSWSSKCDPSFGMMMNDVLGCCTIATAAHMIQVWTANVGSEVTIPDQDIVTAYEGGTSYSPADPTSDRGGVELDILNYWRQTGIGGHQIEGYVAVETKNWNHLKAGVYLFGGLYTGFALPKTAQDQEVWSVVGSAPSEESDPGTWGGHAVPIVAYDDNFLWCVTWGALKRMTRRFADKYMDEAYAVFSPDWMKSGMAPSGFNHAALALDLGRL